MGLDKANRKSFYSCLDSSSTREVPQPLQHLAITKMASMAGGEVVYYLAEDGYTLHTHEVLFERLSKTTGVDGVVFYRLAQFLGLQREPLLPILHDLLIRRRLELHFARERTTLTGPEGFERGHALLRLYSFTKERDRSDEFVKQVIGHLGERLTAAKDGG